VREANQARISNAQPRPELYAMSQSSGWSQEDSAGVLVAAQARLRGLAPAERINAARKITAVHYWPWASQGGVSK
jgi:hypothetical protein